MFKYNLNFNFNSGFTSSSSFSKCYSSKSTKSFTVFPYLFKADLNVLSFSRIVGNKSCFCSTSHLSVDSDRDKKWSKGVNWLVQFWSDTEFEQEKFIETVKAEEKHGCIVDLDYRSRHHAFLTHWSQEKDKIVASLETQRDNLLDRKDLSKESLERLDNSLALEIVEKATKLDIKVLEAVVPDIDATNKDENLHAINRDGVISAWFYRWSHPSGYRTLDRLKWQESYVSKFKEEYHKNDLASIAPEKSEILRKLPSIKETFRQNSCDVQQTEFHSWEPFIDD